MRFAELRPAMILGLALSNPVPAMAGVLFEVEEEFVDSVANPQAVALGDLDGDGIDDAVVVDFFFAGITLFLNDGEGILEDTDFYDTGEGPVAVATGQFNFNGDEFPDIVAVNHTSGTISVFYNNGEGFFDDEEPREFLVGPNPIGVAVADFNGDTLADLAVLSPNLIYLLQGHGDGTFAAFNPATISTQGSDSYAIAAGILSPGDSRVDLAVTNRGSDQIATFFGNGDGTFVLNGRHSIRSAPTGIVITDADGDGANDLVVAASEGELTSEMSLLRNDGEGRFEPVREFTGPEEPLALTTLDVEPDGKVDLVATSSLGGEIFVFCQPSEECVDRSGFPLEAGIWRPALSGTVPGCADAPQVAIVSGKLNEDSKDDFVVLKGEDGEIDTLCIALNRSTVPTPTMVTPSATATTTPPATITPSATTTPSLTATATPSATATIIPSATPTATPPATATVTLTQAPTPSSTPSATPTMTRRHGGDSGCAIAATNQRPDSFVLLLFAALGWCARRRLGRGRGMASSFATTPLRRAEALEGLTESSVPLVLNSVIGKVFPEGAKGSLTRRIVLRPAFALCVVLASAVPAAASVRFNVEEELVDSVSNPQAVALADFNGDSIEDAAVVDVSDGVVVFLNDGEGTLLEDALYDTGEVPVAVATGLFNADAFVDIVVVNSLIGTVSILYNNGEGIFDDEDPRQFLADLDAMGVAVADFNNDGDNDLAVLSPRRIALLQGNGDGTFSAFNPAIIETRSSDSFTIAAGQLDIGNSNVDLAVSNRANNEVAVFIGDGNGTFRFNGMAAAGPAPAGFVIADPNLNGVNDLVVALSEGETTTEMSLLENVGDGVLGAPQLFTGPEVPLAITALDVEPDGKIDLAITSSEGGEIFVLCQPSEICSGQRDFFEAGIWRSAIGGTVRGCADGVQVAIVSGRLNTDRRDDFVALKQNEDGDIDTLCIALNISAVPTPTVAPLGTATPTPTSTPSPTASATPTPSLTPSATPTATRRHGSSDGCGMHDRPQDERSLSLLLLGLLLVGWRGRACRRFRQG